MATYERHTVATFAPLLQAPTAPHVMTFAAHLLLKDSSKQLRRSPELGELSINTTDRVVQFAYKGRKGGSYFRTLCDPHKCVVSARGMKIWSRASTTPVMCAFSTDRDKEGSLEALQVAGARVVDVTEERFIAQEKQTSAGEEPYAARYAAQVDTLATTFAHPQRSRDVASYFSTYTASDQLADDMAVISRAFFLAPPST